MQPQTKKSDVHGIHHIAINVQDFDATVRFYKDGLGLKERLAWGEGDGRAMMLDAGNNNCIEVFAGGKSTPVEGNIVHLALCTGDCDAAFKRALAAGATVVHEPRTANIPSATGDVSVRISFVRAPGGEVIEFFQELHG